MLLCCLFGFFVECQFLIYTSICHAVESSCIKSPEVLEDRENSQNRAVNVLTHEECQDEEGSIWLGRQETENVGFTLDLGCPVKIMKAILRNG